MAAKRGGGDLFLDEALPTVCDRRRLRSPIDASELVIT